MSSTNRNYPRGAPHNILVVALSEPLGVCAGTLTEGLVESGIELTLACARKPDRDWLSRRNLRWLPTPNRKCPLFVRFVRLALYLCRAVGTAPRDVRRFAEYAARSDSLLERITIWGCLLPFAGRRRSVFYFPCFTDSCEALVELGYPFVVSYRGPHVHLDSRDRNRSKKFSRSIFERARAIHCESDSDKTAAVELGLDRSKIWVIRRGVDAEFFAPPRVVEKSEVFRIIATSSFTWASGYEYALVSVRQLIDRGVPTSFEIIGDGPDWQRIQYTVHDLDLLDCASLPGRKARNEVRERLRQAEVFLDSSLSGGYSNGVLEAMACGLPVVATHGAGEAVTNERDGLLVPPRNPTAMANALERLWKNPELRRQLGAAARATVESQFRLDRRIRLIKELFAEVDAADP